MLRVDAAPVPAEVVNDKTFGYWSVEPFVDPAVRVDVAFPGLGFEESVAAVDRVGGPVPAACFAITMELRAEPDHWVSANVLLSHGLCRVHETVQLQHRLRLPLLIRS